MGIVTKILFPRNGERSDNGFYILNVRVRTVEGIVKGVMTDCKENMTYKFVGVRQHDTARNTVFVKITTAEEILDATPHGIISYLATECPTVGDTMAAALVEKYGLNTLNCLNDPHRLALEVKGIDIERAAKISDWAKSEEANRGTKKELYTIGCTPGQIKRILAAYGANAKEKMQKDCFRLIELDGFGYSTVAKIADLMGIPKTDPGRIQAGIVACFQSFFDEGDVCVARSNIIRDAGELVGVSQQAIVEQLDKMIANGKLVDASNLPERLKIDQIIKSLDFQPKLELDFGVKPDETDASSNGRSEMGVNGQGEEDGDADSGD
jgi:exodeoxyribonuclease V alpha subunit